LTDICHSTNGTAYIVVLLICQQFNLYKTEKVIEVILFNYSSFESFSSTVYMMITIGARTIREEATRYAAVPNCLLAKFLCREMS
jgi:hypothetical protein